MTETIETTNRKQYLPRHVWVRVDNAGRLEIGVTSAGLDALSGLSYADLPEAGTMTTAGSVLLTLEGRKAVEDVVSPADGQVVISRFTAANQLDFEDHCDELALVVLGDWTMPPAVVNQLTAEDLG